MSRASQLAQKTKIFISGTGGSAKTITDIDAGYPTIVTSAAHGLSDGDVVDFASIVGTIGTDGTYGLNGKSVVVKYSTTNTFSVDIDTTNLVYTSGGTATPKSWIQIKEVKAIKPSGSSKPKIDVTDLDSDAMEYISGLPDNGSISLDIAILESDPGQGACLEAYNNASAANKNFRVSSPTKHRTFEGAIVKWPSIPDSSVNGVQTGSAEIQVSGIITVTDV